MMISLQKNLPKTAYIDIDSMITVQESIYLLSSGLTSEIYLPEEYLTIYDVQLVAQQYNWTIVPSVAQGWILLRRRMVFQD